MLSSTAAPPATTPELGAMLKRQHAESVKTEKSGLRHTVQRRHGARCSVERCVQLLARLASLVSERQRAYQRKVQGVPVCCNASFDRLSLWIWAVMSSFVLCDAVSSWLLFLWASRRWLRPGGDEEAVAVVVVDLSHTENRETLLVVDRHRPCRGLWSRTLPARTQLDGVRPGRHRT